MGGVIAGRGWQDAEAVRRFMLTIGPSAKELQPSTAHPTGKLRPYHLRLAREEMERRGVLGGMRLGQGTGTGTDTRSSRGMFRR